MFCATAWSFGFLSLDFLSLKIEDCQNVLPHKWGLGDGIILLFDSCVCVFAAIQKLVRATRETCLVNSKG